MGQTRGGSDFEDGGEGSGRQFRALILISLALITLTCRHRSHLPLTRTSIHMQFRLHIRKLLEAADTKDIDALFDALDEDKASLHAIGCCLKWNCSERRCPHGIALNGVALSLAALPSRTCARAAHAAIASDLASGSAPPLPLYHPLRPPTTSP